MSSFSAELRLSWRSYLDIKRHFEYSLPNQSRIVSKLSLLKLRTNWRLILE